MSTLEGKEVISLPKEEEDDEIELKESDDLSDTLLVDQQQQQELKDNKQRSIPTTATTATTKSNKPQIIVSNNNDHGGLLPSSLNFLRSKWEDWSGIKQDLDTTVKYGLEERMAKVRMYWKSTLFVTGLMYFFNFLFLYFGTVFESEVAQPHKFFGFKEGQHCHLQRTNGILWLLLSCVNFFALAKDEDRGKNSVLLFSAVCNAIMSVHYALEMFYFVSMRIEIIAIQVFILCINQYWTWTDFRHRRQVYALRGQDPNLALRDEGVRQKLNKIKEKKIASKRGVTSSPTILAEEKPIAQASRVQRRKKSALA